MPYNPQFNQNFFYFFHALHCYILTHPAKKSVKIKILRLDLPKLL